MEDVKEQMTKVLEHFKQQRDELHVQLHLANADAKDEWARLENQWEETKSKLEAAREEVDKTTESCVIKAATSHGRIISAPLRWGSLCLQHNPFRTISDRLPFGWSILGFLADRHFPVAHNATCF